MSASGAWDVVTAPRHQSKQLRHRSPPPPHLPPLAIGGPATNARETIILQGVGEALLTDKADPGEERLNAPTAAYGRLLPRWAAEQFGFRWTEVRL